MPNIICRKHVILATPQWPTFFKRLRVAKNNLLRRSSNQVWKRPQTVASFFRLLYPEPERTVCLPCDSTRLHFTEQLAFFGQATDKARTWFQKLHSNEGAKKCTICPYSQWRYADSWQLYLCLFVRQSRRATAHLHLNLHNDLKKQHVKTAVWHGLTVCVCVCLYMDLYQVWTGLAFWSVLESVSTLPGTSTPLFNKGDFQWCAELLWPKEESLLVNPSMNSRMFWRIMSWSRFIILGRSAGASWPTPTMFRTSQRWIQSSRRIVVAGAAPLWTFGGFCCISSSRGSLDNHDFWSWSRYFCRFFRTFRFPWRYTLDLSKPSKIFSCCCCCHHLGELWTLWVHLWVHRRIQICIHGSHHGSSWCVEPWFGFRSLWTMRVPSDGPHRSFRLPQLNRCARGGLFDTRSPYHRPWLHSHNHFGCKYGWLNFWALIQFLYHQCRQTNRSQWSRSCSRDWAWRMRLRW